MKRLDLIYKMKMDILGNEYLLFKQAKLTKDEVSIIKDDCLRQTINEVLNRQSIDAVYTIAEYLKSFHAEDLSLTKEFVVEAKALRVVKHIETINDLYEEGDYNFPFASDLEQKLEECDFIDYL